MEQHRARVATLSTYAAHAVRMVRPASPRISFSTPRYVVAVPEVPSKSSLPMKQTPSYRLKKKRPSPTTPMLDKMAVQLCCRVVRRQLKYALWTFHDHAYRRLSRRASSVHRTMLSTRKGTLQQPTQVWQQLTNGLSRWRVNAKAEREMTRLRLFGPLPGAAQIVPESSSSKSAREAQSVRSPLRVTPALALAAANSDLVSCSGDGSGADPPADIANRPHATASSAFTANSMLSPSCQHCLTTPAARQSKPRRASEPEEELDSDLPQESVGTNARVGGRQIERRSMSPLAPLACLLTEAATNSCEAHDAQSHHHTNGDGSPPVVAASAALASAFAAVEAAVKLAALDTVERGTVSAALEAAESHAASVHRMAHMTPNHKSTLALARPEAVTTSNATPPAHSKQPVRGLVLPSTPAVDPAKSRELELRLRLSQWLSHHNRQRALKRVRALRDSASDAHLLLACWRRFCTAVSAQLMRAWLDTPPSRVVACAEMQGDTCPLALAFEDPAMPMEALTTYMAKDSAVAAPMGGALAVIAQRHATRSALKTSFCAWQQRHPYAGGTEALSPKGKSSPYRLRRLLMLTPQMPRVASGRAMRRALQTWQGEALAKARCEFAGNARQQYNLRQSMHTWHRAKANASLALARDAAARHLYRRHIIVRAPAVLRCWHAAAVRSKLLDELASIPWPGACSYTCEGLRARWGAWQARAHVLSARASLQRAVGHLCEARSLGRVLQRWRRYRHAALAELGLLRLRDALSMGAAARRWRRGAYRDHVRAATIRACDAHYCALALGRAVRQWRRTKVALKAAHGLRRCCVAQSAVGGARRALGRWVRHHYEALEEAAVHHDATRYLALRKWHRHVVGPNGRSLAAARAHMAAAEELLGSGLGSTKRRCMCAIVRWRSFLRSEARLESLYNACLSSSKGRYASAWAKWRSLDRAQAQLEALHHAWRWRQAQLRREVCWRRWAETACDGPSTTQSRHVWNALSRWSERHGGLLRSWRRWVAHASRNNVGAALAYLALPLLLSRVLRQWAAIATRARQSSEAMARARPLLFDRPWRRWLAFMSASYAASALMAQVLPHLNGWHRATALRSGLARWKRWVVLESNTSLQSAPSTHRLRYAWRSWRRMRAVVLAVWQRRCAHRMRWALCRAWGKWRLRAVLRELGPMPDEKCSVKAVDDWLEPMHSQAESLDAEWGAFSRDSWRDPVSPFSVASSDAGSGVASEDQLECQPELASVSHHLTAQLHSGLRLEEGLGGVAWRV